ncbi:hypothetical protein [Mesoplasma photuris]|uniref:mannitol dehydrogenase family protein n=1 Tax=Mesoplasma photuris TaxID=217731 RepID=UPI0004E17714|nr:hypothetical protein [Mesoplasma photuris]
MSKVIHFGAGNIGRGFIAPILLKNKNIDEIKFLDVNEEIIKNLNENKSYIVNELDIETNQIIVDRYSSSTIKGIREDSNFKNFLKDTFLITTSTGQNNLKFIIDDLKFIIDSIDKNQKIIIICCENGNRVSSYFKNEYEEKHSIPHNVYFVDCMVDRIVPIQLNNSLDIDVEKYYSWIVDSTQWPAEINKIDNLTYSENMEIDIYKKMTMLNGVHASLGWFRYKQDKFAVPILQDTLDDQDTFDYLKGLMENYVKIISLKFKYDEQILKNYGESIIKRFENKLIRDELYRVARNPITKLQKNERIVDPLLFAYENDLEVNYLKQAFVNGMNYFFEEDKEALELKEISTNNQGISKIEKVIKNLSKKQNKILSQILN